MYLFDFVFKSSILTLAIHHNDLDVDIHWLFSLCSLLSGSTYAKILLVISNKNEGQPI